MDVSTQNRTINDLEKALCKVRGVKAARIVGNGKGLEEIHIITTYKKNGTRLSDDVETFLLNEFGISIDPKKINIARASTNQIYNSNKDIFKLKSLVIDNHMFSTTVKISLSNNDNIFNGLATGSSAKKYRDKIIAEATLDALEKAHNGLAFCLDNLKVMDFGSKSMLCANISITRKDIIGSALRDDGQEDEATVSTILNAVDKCSDLL